METTAGADASIEWNRITNAVTGEVVTFIERGPDRCVFDLAMPSGRVPVVTHRHPGAERFDVTAGKLRLTVDGVVHDLAAGATFTVLPPQFHAPTNDSGEVVRVRVSCTRTDGPAGLGYFAERGMRMTFGMSHDGRTAADGRPRDLLALALGSERGQFQILGPPTFVWRPLMVVLGMIAVVMGRRRVLASYWPPDLPRPWDR